MRTAQQPPIDAPVSDAQRVESYQGAIREVHKALGETTGIMEDIAQLVLDYFEGKDDISEQAVKNVCEGALLLAANTRETFELPKDEEGLTKPPQ